MKVLSCKTATVQRAVQVSSAHAKALTHSAFTGARVAVQPRRAAVVERSAVRTMAFFGSSTKTAGDSIYDLKVKLIDGKEVAMSKYKGKVLLIANVASACGFTPQYKDMVELYNKYQKDGFEILAMPCNAFGSQEPGSNSQIKSFAERQGAKFTMLAKGDVNGNSEEPLWTFLKGKKGGLIGKDIQWNFTKFLVDREGNVVKRYAPTNSPLSFENDIKALL